MENTIKIGNKIKKLRELRNYTQEHMADAIGMSQTGYSKIERDETDISLGKIEKIAQVLDINIFDLLGFDEKYAFFGSVNNHSGTSNGLVLNSSTFETERKLYEEQISNLKNELFYLKEMLDFFKNQLNRANPAQT